MAMSMSDCACGNRRHRVSSHRVMFTDTTRQRDARQSAGPERYLVCRQAGVQMARAAQAVRQLAHHLYAHESLVEERGVRSRLCSVAIGPDHSREDQSRGRGQYHRQGPSGWHRGVKKTARKPSASRAADGPLSFIELPQMLERSYPLPCLLARPTMPPRDASCCTASEKEGCTRFPY